MTLNNRLQINIKFVKILMIYLNKFYSWLIFNIKIRDFIAIFLFIKNNF